MQRYLHDAGGRSPRVSKPDRLFVNFNIILSISNVMNMIHQIKSYRKNAFQKGIVGVIVLIIIAIVLFSYFGINLKELSDKPIFKENLSFIREISITIWNSYLLPIWNNVLKTPVLFLWSKLIGLLS